MLASGRVVARAMGAELEFLWPITPACGAPFERLFEACPDVRTVPAGEVEGLPRSQGIWGAPQPDLLLDPREHVQFVFVSWLVMPDLYPSHRALWPELALELEALTPSAAIRERVESVSAAFRPTMIGVHLRRGDFRVARPDVVDNTDAAIARVAEHLVAHPNAGVFLATDDDGADLQGAEAGGVRARFHARFGARMVGAVPRSLDRESPEAIEDAWVELLLLRRCDAIVGTRGSSFSELAAFGRQVPFDCPDGTPAQWRQRELWARGTGVYPIIMELARRAVGREPDSFFMACSALREAFVATRAGGALRWVYRFGRRL